MANTKWEVSVIELKKNGKTKYKVTRRLPEMSVAETKIFDMSEIAKINNNCSDFRACSKIVSI